MPPIKKTKKTSLKNSEQPPATLLNDEPSFEKRTTPMRRKTLERMKNQCERYPALKFKKGADDKGVTYAETDPAMALFQTFETTGTDNANLANHLIQQAYRVQPEWSALWNTTTALLHGIAPQDLLEGLLATQMAAAHEMAMEFSSRTMTKDQSVEAVERNVNRATKMMRTFIAQMEALSKYRSKGQQTIQVQHVNVNDGGQAIVGTVNQGGGGNENKNE
ncbi:MAG: hypothetical protein K2X66_09290 [Cyanobacteria bacterium]|nr:hypothetical protein [Cyanobacteriota bacterium]